MTRLWVVVLTVAAITCSLACNTSRLTPRAGTLRGRVVDCTTGAPVGGAHFDAPKGKTYSQSTGAERRTFPDGTFWMHRVVMGSDRLDFEKDGYKTRVVFLQPNQDWVDVCLERR